MQEWGPLPYYWFYVRHLKINAWRHQVCCEALLRMRQFLIRHSIYFWDFEHEVQALLMYSHFQRAARSPISETTLRQQLMRTTLFFFMRLAPTSYAYKALSKRKRRFRLRITVRTMLRKRRLVVCCQYIDLDAKMCILEQCIVVPETSY